MKTLWSRKGKVWTVLAAVLGLGALTAGAGTWWYCDLGNRAICIDVDSGAGGSDLTIFGFQDGGGVWSQICTKCHQPGKLAAYKFPANSQAGNIHLTQHFPKYRMQLAQGQSLDLGRGVLLANQGGLLQLKQGKQVKSLPADAFLVKGPLSPVPMLVLRGRAQL